MAIFKLFKPPKHQQYEYKPRYWNPRKEALEKRLQEIDELKANNPDVLKSRISQGFKNGGSAAGAGMYAERSKYRSKQTRRSNFILLGIVIFLLFLTYVFLTVYLPEFEQLLEHKHGIN